MEGQRLHCQEAFRDPTVLSSGGRPAEDVTAWGTEMRRQKETKRMVRPRTLCACSAIQQL